MTLEHCQRTERSCIGKASLFWESCRRRYLAAAIERYFGSRSATPCSAWQLGRIVRVNFVAMRVLRLCVTVTGAAMCAAEHVHIKMQRCQRTAAELTFQREQE
jgi:hypothetical protein